MCVCVCGGGGGGCPRATCACACVHVILSGLGCCVFGRWTSFERLLYFLIRSAGRDTAARAHPSPVTGKLPFSPLSTPFYCSSEFSGLSIARVIITRLKHRRFPDTFIQTMRFMLDLPPLQNRLKLEQVRAYFSAVKNLQNSLHEAVKDTKGCRLGRGKSWWVK